MWGLSLSVLPVSQCQTSGLTQHVGRSQTFGFLMNTNQSSLVDISIHN